MSKGGFAQLVGEPVVLNAAGGLQDGVPSNGNRIHNIR